MSLGVPVDRPAVLETTALGCWASRRPLATDFYPSVMAAVSEARRIEKTFHPQIERIATSTAT